MDELPWNHALICKKHFNIDDNAFLKYPRQPLRDYQGGKVWISDLDIRYKPFLRAVIDHYRNGVVVIDDASIYERDDTSDELNELIAMRRHIGVDVIMIYYGLTMLPIRQFPFVNRLVLFHTADNFDYKVKSCQTP